MAAMDLEIKIDCKQAELAYIQGMLSAAVLERVILENKIGALQAKVREIEGVNPGSDRFDDLQKWVLQQGEFTIDQAAKEVYGLGSDQLTRPVRTIIGVHLRTLGCRKIERRASGPRFWFLAPASAA